MNQITTAIAAGLRMLGRTYKKWLPPIGILAGLILFWINRVSVAQLIANVCIVALFIAAIIGAMSIVYKHIRKYAIRIALSSAILLFIAQVLMSI